MRKLTLTVPLILVLAMAAGCSNQKAKEFDARLTGAENSAAAAQVRADDAYSKSEQALSAANQAQQAADKADESASRMLQKATRK